MWTQGGWCDQMLAEARTVCPPGEDDPRDIQWFTERLVQLENFGSAHRLPERRAGLDDVGLLTWPRDTAAYKAQHEKWGDVVTATHLVMTRVYAGMRNMREPTRAQKAQSTPIMEMRMRRRVDCALMPIDTAFDVLLYNLESQERTIRPCIRPAIAGWDEMRTFAIPEDKDGNEKPNWNLILQLHLGAYAMRNDLVLFNGAVFHRRPGARVLIEAVMQQITDDHFQPSTLEAVVWKNLIDRTRDPDMYVAAQTNNGFIKAACDFYLKKSTPEMPHVVPSTRFFSFRNAVLQIYNDSGPRLAVIPTAEVLSDLVVRSHIDQDIDSSFLSKPLCAAFWRNDGQNDRTLLDWLTREPTEEERVECKQGNIFLKDGYLARDASVLLSKLALQDLSPQMIFLLLAVLGRMCYTNCKYDNWQVAGWICGITGSGKSALILNMLNELFASDAVGTVSAKNVDKFWLARCMIWRVLVLNEVRKDSNLPEGDILKITAGEELDIRPMGEDWIKVAHAHFTMLGIGNDKDPPFSNVAGEFARRFLVFPFPNTFDGNADTTISEQRRAQNAGNLCMMLRCYIALREALGTSSIRSYLPWDMQRATEDAKWMSDYVYKFLNSPAVVLSFETPAESLADFATGPANREVSTKTTFDDLAKAFRVWLREAHPRSNAPWTVDRIAPALERMGLPYNLSAAFPLSAGRIVEWPQKYEHVDQLRHRIYPIAGNVHYITLSPSMKETLEKKKTSY